MHGSSTFRKLPEFLAGGFPAQPVPRPERQDEQSDDGDGQADLCTLGNQGDAAAAEKLVAQRRVGEPAEAGVRVAPCDEAPRHYRHKASDGNDGGKNPGRRRSFAVFRCVVVPHAGESSRAARGVRLRGKTGSGQRV